ncbi:TetR/AcrR family transcriptional regulator [Amycolatopsis sp. FDAARGOS 1241]|uniref:TetR/AcrR family transcriptional regulator n=1 Tax=Amycolatopsis sp. FDAARGOS 1241 TaxID=2778070 RepID=UPI00194E7A00|nr:TetR/AcrR family transcriptional regulator [Amycolatopsis sp. FDAARGOS 1241]QRP44890.1 TetR family transcriptional regulator [Amycolatopsis sp. FDAARGOS 1241]
MITRDPAAKRQRLLEAAFAEFAAHGIAGARVDRIAKRAKCSAGLGYTYFGGKDDLFDAVFEVATGTSTPLTANDLPGYAGKLFDAQEANPDTQRLLTWYRLDRGGSVTTTSGAKVDTLREAQRASELSDRFDPEQLRALVHTLASMCSAPTQETPDLPRERRRDRSRAPARGLARKP